MGSNIRAEFKVENVNACPLSQISATEGVTCRLVSRTTGDSESGQLMEEFVSDNGIEFEDESITEVFTYSSKSVYRYRRNQCVDCPCMIFDACEKPIADVRAYPDRMMLVTHLRDMDELHQILGKLRDRYPQTSIHSLIRSDGKSSHRDLVLFDMGDITDRQREVLEVAHAMGYFEYPKEANLGEIAEFLDISRSTVSQHLSSAQNKIISSIFDG